MNIFKNRQKNPILLIFLIVLHLLIFCGIIFRFSNLDRKIVWHDEALSISRVSGYYAKEINQDIFNGKVINVEKLKSYQSLNERSKNLDVIDILAKDNPQHPPVYYLLLRLWVRVFGVSLISWRSLSAVFSFLALPCIFILCKELGESNSTSLISTALVSVSPISILYAQEAREYSLWVFSVLISSILFLKAVKRKKNLNWELYAVFSGLGLYIFPFSLFVSTSHFFYLIGREGLKLTQNVRKFAISLTFAISCFVPWAYLIVDQWEESGSQWTSLPGSRISLFHSWGKHLQRLFFVETSNNQDLGYYIMMLGLLVIIGYSFYLLFRQKPKHTWLFIVCLSLSLFLPLAGSDLLFGGQRSVASRYLFPSLLGLKISLGISLGSCILGKKFIISRSLSFILLTIILVFSLTSSTILLMQEVSWNKGDSSYLVKVSKIINKEHNSLIIGNSSGLNLGNLLALSNLLSQDQNNKLLLVDGWQK